MQERNGAALGRVRLFGQAQSNEAYQIRDLLTRSVVAFDCGDAWVCRMNSAYSGRASTMARA